MKNWDRVIVIGAGGTGSLLFNPLCRYLYSVGFNGEIYICDGDTYSFTNSSRQIFASSKVGMNKAEYQALAVSSQLPEMSDYISYIDKYLSQSDIEKMIIENTVVINCVDNLAARKYVEDRVSEMNNAAHICCGNEMRHGQVQISLRIDGHWASPSIYEQSPLFNSNNDDRSEMTCQEIEALESGGQIIAANMTCAALALNYFTQLMPAQSNAVFNGEYIPYGFVSFDTMLNSYENKSQNEVPSLC